MRLLPSDLSPVASRDRRQRAALLGLLLLGLVLLVAERWNTRQEVRAAERATLQSQARTVDDSLQRQLRAARIALHGVRTDLRRFPVEQQPDFASRRLSALANAVPALRAMAWLGADGVVLASSAPSLVGSNLSSLAYFRTIRDAPRAEALSVTEPFVSMDGVRTVAIAVPLLDAAGGFAGTVSALLEPEFLQSLIAATLYAPDMQGLLVHGGSGQVVLQHPQPAVGQGLQGSVLQVDSPLARHLRGRHETQELEGRLPQPDGTPGAVRLLALRTLQQADLQMDHPLLLVLSRDRAAVLAPWLRDTVLASTLLLLAGATAWFTLLALQRQQSEVDALAAATAVRAAADSERLALALRGGDLALWDARLDDASIVINERWATMLGYTLAEHAAGQADWLQLLHADDRDRVLALQQAHLDGRTAAYEATYRMRHKQGHWVWVLDRGQVVERGPGGQPLRMVGTHMDVSRRMLAEDALRRSEESLAVTLHSIGDAVIATDAGGRITRINGTAERLTGWPAAEALGRPLGDVFRIHNAQTLQPVPDPVSVVLESDRIVGLANDTVLTARDGTQHQIADSAAPIRDPGAGSGRGGVRGVVLVFSDVTEHYRMLQALRRSEAQLAQLAAALPGPVARLDAEGRYLFNSAAFEHWFGHGAEAVRGRHWRDVHPPDLHAAVEPEMAQALQGQPRHFDLTLRTLQGLRETIVTLLPDRAPGGAVQGIFLVVTDITARKQAEEALRRSERQTRALFDALQSGVVVHAADGTLIDVNPAACNMLGQPREALIGQRGPPPGVTLLQEDGTLLPAERRPVPRVIATRQPVENMVAGLLRPGLAHPLWALRNAFPVFGDDGSLQRVVVTFTDIGALKQAEEGLQRSRQKLRNASRMARLGGWYHDLAARRCTLSDELALLVGLPADTPLAEDVALGIVLPEQREPLRELARRCAQQGTAFDTEVGISGPGGRTLQMRVLGEPVRSAAGSVVALEGAAQDVTESRLAQQQLQRLEGERSGLERQLREAQKMESIGTLAGGIAHDFNNILPAILGNVALARAALQPGHAALNSLEQINRAALRARSLVQQILTFSRRQPTALQPQPLRPVVEETLALLRATLPAAVRLDTVLADETLVVEADATQLQQVLMNLCTNAWHALPEAGGRIEVGLQAMVGEDSAPQVHLWVRDSGSGMDAATLQRIFDPFFTTKPVGHGTGLGLSVAHGIVRAHRGSIRAESQPGHGSTFHVLLPLLTLPEPARSAAGQLAPPAHGTGQAVLYVDDDDVMGVLVQSLLQRDGYAVEACAGGQEALALLRARPGRFELLVTDFNMPGMSGIELARAAMALQPGLPVIISSGYLTEALRRQAAEAGVRALLRKENTLERLSALVQKTLAGAGQPAADVGDDGKGGSAS